MFFSFFPSVPFPLVGLCPWRSGRPRKWEKIELTKMLYFATKRCFGYRCYSFNSQLWVKIVLQFIKKITIKCWPNGSRLSLYKTLIKLWCLLMIKLIHSVATFKRKSVCSEIWNEKNNYLIRLRGCDYHRGEKAWGNLLGFRKLDTNSPGKSLLFIMFLFTSYAEKGGIPPYLFSGSAYKHTHAFVCVLIGVAALEAE